jgi:hypothetical protein
MLRRAVRIAEAGGRASRTRASAASGACSASAAACETRGGVRPRADAGSRRWVSGDPARGGESASEAASRTASSSAASSSASAEALVRAGKSLEFDQAAELVFAANRTGKLGWDWHAWHFAASLVPAGVAYAWAQHILASDPEIRRMVEESRGNKAGGESASEASADGGDESRGGDALDDLRRRLTRLETALAEQQRDAGVVVARGSSRGADAREEGARMNADAKRRETEETEHPSTTPASSSSGWGWRAAWRRARRFASRVSLSRREGSEEE